MRTDALHDLIRNVGDDSPAEHKALFILWSALDDIEHDRPSVNHTQHVIARAMERASAALSTIDRPEGEDR
jgi:hypothetical protein